uniref:(northern house mosquito) hypothetical protein n=1 Tax=Culex pipiens TaxID=7175 RepID=A0A8D8NTQ1_CULPI
MCQPRCNHILTEGGKTRTKSSTKKKYHFQPNLKYRRLHRIKKNQISLKLYRKETVVRKNPFTYYSTYPSIRLGFISVLYRTTVTRARSLSNPEVSKNNKSMC